MADGTAGGGAAGPPDILWTFPGQIATDQDSNIVSYIARKATALVAFDVNCRVAPTGDSILIDWAINDVIDPSLQVEVAIGDTYGETVFPITLAVDDEIRPILTQVGSATPGQSILMRARGS